MNSSTSINHSSDINEFRFLEARPGITMILRPDAPLYTIVAVSDDFVSTSGRKRDEVIGKSHFFIFPENPADPDSSGIQSLRHSFDFIRQHKTSHSLPLVRYDIPDGAGAFLEKYWKSTNAPILNEKGEVEFIIHTSEDVTSQIKAEQTKEEYLQLVKAYQKVEESEQKYRTLFESIDQGFCVLEMIFDEDHHPVDYRFLEINPAFEQQTGLKNSIGKTARELIPNLEKHWFEAYGKVAVTGQSFRFVERSDAMGRWFDVFAYQVGGEKSRKVGLLFRDITERKKTEEALYESEQQIRALLESAPFPLGVYVGREMRIQYANKAMIRAFGKGDAIIGKLYKDVLPEFEPVIYQRLDDVFTTGKPFHAQNELISIRMDGKLQPFFYSYSFIPLFDASGKVYGIMNTASDVTELNKAKQRVEESENNLRNIILQAPVAMCIFRGKEQVVEIANESMLQIWGKKREEVIGKPTFEGIPEGRNQGFEEILENIHQTGQPFRINEIPVTLVRHGKKEMFYTNLSYEPIKDAEGHVTGILVVGIEVTQQVLARRKIEEVVTERTQELEKANLELKRSNQNLEEFAYAASHDMKEPIRKIHFFADRLKERLLHKLENEDRRYFERLEAGTKRMSTLIDDLLLYSHVNRGLSTIESVDLNQVLSFVLDDLELHIEQKNARIEVEPLPTIRGRTRQLQQLFENLLGNALKYSKEGVLPVVNLTSRMVKGSQSGVPAAAVNANQMYHLIQVKDNGIGFDQEDAERIFMVFTRLHGNSEYRGTGVGLSIAQRVVQNHGGYIWAESTPGEGATFHILLPAEYMES